MKVRELLSLYGKHLKYTEEDYKAKCMELDVEYVGNHKETKLGTVIDYICKKHRDNGVQSKDWSHFRTFKKSCPYCSGRYKTNVDILPLIKNKDVVLISDYLGNEKPIQCKCKKCNHEWITQPKVLMTNGSGCPECGKNVVRNARRKSHEQFVNELAEVNKNIEVVGQYINTHHLITCRCRICDHQWDTYPANLLNLSAGCPRCNFSIGERMMLDTLTEIGIDWVSQYSIPDCRNIHKLRFDAFDIEHRIAFEFNGEQHYRPVDWGNNKNGRAEKEFEVVQYRDNLKKSYCENNGIQLVIIPYWEINNMKEFILSNLNERIMQT